MVNGEILEELFERLKKDDWQSLLSTCEKIRVLSKDFDVEQKKRIADGLTSLFYVPVAEKSEFTCVVDCAIEALVSLGAPAIDILIQGLSDGDPDVNLLVAKTLARMGPMVTSDLLSSFKQSTDPYQKSLTLYAFSLMDDPALIQAFPEIVNSLDDENPEVRDTAARAIGKLFKCYTKGCISHQQSNLAFEKLIGKISDPHGGTRSKAIRSIGIMGEMGLMNADQRTRAVTAIESILGIDGHHDWDKAFIVRREAEEAYKRITGGGIHSSETCASNSKQSTYASPAEPKTIN